MGTKESGGTVLGPTSAAPVRAPAPTPELGGATLRTKFGREEGAMDPGATLVTAGPTDSGVGTPDCGDDGAGSNGIGGDADCGIARRRSAEPAREAGGLLATLLATDPGGGAVGSPDGETTSCSPDSCAP